MSTPNIDTPSSRLSDSSRRSPMSRPVNVLFAVVGAVIVVGAVATTAFSSGLMLTHSSQSQTVDTAGISAVEVDSDAADFTVRFDAVDEAVLETSGVSRGQWELTRTGSVLEVDSPSAWANWCWFWCESANTMVTLVLPEELSDGSLALRLEADAGSMRADGDFESVVLEVNAGEAHISGSATAVEAELNAGKVNVALSNLETVDLSVSAGHMVAEALDTAPRNVIANVNAGMLDLSLPEGGYDVRSTVNAGNLLNNLQDEPGSDHRVQVTVNAGRVSLTPER